MQIVVMVSPMKNNGIIMITTTLLVFLLHRDADTPPNCSKFQGDPS